MPSVLLESLPRYKSGCVEPVLKFPTLSETWASPTEQH